MSILDALSNEADARAVALHRESLVVDSLCIHGPLEESAYTEVMRDRIADLTAHKASAAAIIVAIEEIAHDARLRDELPGFWTNWDQAGVDVVSVTQGVFGKGQFSFHNAVRDLAHMAREFDILADRLLKVTRAADARLAKAEGKCGVILNFQNSDHLDGDLANLGLFYELGVRVIQLTYNKRNLAGDGCTEPAAAGLSNWGIELVRQMNELGVLVDLSHCSDRTTRDGIEKSAKPVAVTHAAARAIYPHARCKPDDVIRAIGESGGYFGVCLVPFFLSGADEPTLDDWLRHFEHVAELAGIENVGVASDYERNPRALSDVMNAEILKYGFGSEHRVDWNITLDGFRTWSEWPNVTRALVSRGYSDDEIRGVLGGNFLRVFAEAVGG